ncbi:MAG: DUF1318 domain-containing protein [Pseudomonadota bacterium]|nr:DUF1318 domain-containing protein [Pseudomonadota bacterium]
MNSSVFVWAMILFVGISCVTVNVNFPEGAVQKAADDYVKELYNAKEKDEAETADKKPSSFFHINLSLISVAHAQEFKVDTAKAKEIQSRQKARIDDLKEHLKEGQIGESANGLVEVRAPSDIKPILMKKIEKLVQDENADREALYDEVISSNGLSSSVRNQVKASFAKSFQGAAPKGTLIESTKGKWDKK